jgi:hypothetical protein
MTSLQLPLREVILPAMSEDQTAEADRRLQEVLEASGARDPREFYRDRLRELKSADASAYSEAVAYYKDRLIPEVAAGSVDPLVGWAEYGRMLAEALAPGRTVSIDTTGIADPYEPPAPPDRLVLHIPQNPGVRALLVSLPATLSAAQRATYDVLVSGKQRHQK